MSALPPSLLQAEPEVWLVLDGRRVLARLRAAGPSWIHVFIEGDSPVDDRVPFTVVLRGADGGVVDGLAHRMSGVRKDGRTILHLRLTHLSTSGRRGILERFVRDVLRDREGATEPLSCFADSGVHRAVHRPHRLASVPGEVPVASDLIVVSMPVVWRVDGSAVSGRIVQSSSSGRRLVVRRKGPPPSSWETVRLEMDLGVSGEPRPVQLVGMVIGTVPMTQAPSGSTDVIVRLVRWSADSDRAVWSRWIRHQQRLDTSLQRVAGGTETRTAPRPGVRRCGLLT